MNKLLEDAVQVIKVLGERLELHKAGYRSSIDPACHIHQDEYKKLQALNLPKLLAVVEVLKFYAKPETYESETLDGIRITYTYPIEKDRGKKARKAIETLDD